MYNLQSFDIYYCLTVQSVLLRYNSLVAFVIFLPGNILLKDCRVYPINWTASFTLKCSSNYWYYQHAHFHGSFYCFSLTTSFDCSCLFKFRFACDAGTFFDDLASELKTAKAVSKWRFNKLLCIMDLYKHVCVCVWMYNVYINSFSMLWNLFDLIQTELAVLNAW